MSRRQREDARLQEAGSAMLRVNGARGFLIVSPGSLHLSLVVTAAHCLPHLPPPHLGSYTRERTYAALLGPLSDTPSAVWAECLFADPVADVAVLTCPDNQVLPDEADAYDALIESLVALPIRAAQQGPAWVRGLDGRWFRCDVEHAGSPLWTKPAEPVVGGMSGSPLIQAGAVIGVVSTTVETRDTPVGGGASTRASMVLQAACLSLDLPHRLLQQRVQPPTGGST